MKRNVGLMILSFVVTMAWAQGPNGTGTYYSSANGKKGQELKTALYQIIKNPDVDTYDQLWVDYKYTDRRDDGCLWEMYSNATNYVIGGENQGATIHGEGDSYNREHSMPKSWFSSATPMYSDIMHVVPVDGYVNSTRNNFPYGENTGNIRMSENDFSKLGTCTIEGYGKTVFEPNDLYKGDLARIYFYMATCYEDVIPTWSSVSNGVDEIFTANAYKPYADWQLTMLMQWAANDGVSQKEVNRNNAVYKIQGNRNPFVDFPGLEDYIWGDKQDVAFDYEHFPNATYGGEIIVKPEETFDPTTITASIGEQTYQRIDYAGDLEVGGRYLIVNESKGRVIMDNDGTYQRADYVTVTNDTIKTEVGVGKANEYVLLGRRDGYRLYNPANQKYLAVNTDASNTLVITDQATNDSTRWTIKFNNKGNIKITNKKFNERFIGYNTSVGRFVAYKSTSFGAYVLYPQLYKNVTATTTGIQGLVNAPSSVLNSSNAVYTIHGIRITDGQTKLKNGQLPKGIYIVGGKKVVVKE